MKMNHTEKIMYIAGSILVISIWCLAIDYKISIFAIIMAYFLILFDTYVSFNIDIANLP
jgi:hypothetical protein